MRHLAFALSALLVAFGASCNCGGGTQQPPEGLCADDSDCASGRCGPQQQCLPPELPGSGSGVDAGSKPDSGVLPRPCDNLQCQVPSCTGGAVTSISGKVYDPAGNVPLYNAIVYVPNGPLAPFTSGPTCDACGALVSGAPLALAISGADGTFTLNNVPAGNNVPLVVQIGKWRRQVTLPTVTACQNNALTDPNLSRLPRSRMEGDIPQMALASGEADAFECLLRKIGIDEAEFTAPAQGGRVHFYRENGMSLAGGTPRGADLWTDAGTLGTYDVVVLPCEGEPNNKPSASVQNMVRYANSGGRIFTTHYGYVWTQPGWPQSADWRPKMADLFNETFYVNVNRSFPKGQAFADWLVNVGASQDAGTLGLRESRHDVVSVKTGATAWLTGNITRSAPPESVQHLTFNTPFLDAGTLPDGGAAPQCGRVVYSDFHVTAGATDGGSVFPTSCTPGPLTPQEKTLEFMLFDLSACVQSDAMKPMACSAFNQECSSNADCCTGLTCMSNGQACTGSGCACDIKID